MEHHLQDHSKEGPRVGRHSIVLISRSLSQFLTLTCLLCDHRQVTELL